MMSATDEHRGADHEETLSSLLALLLLAQLLDDGTPVGGLLVGLGHARPLLGAGSG